LRDGRIETALAICHARYLDLASLEDDRVTCLDAGHDAKDDGRLARP